MTMLYPSKVDAQLLSGTRDINFSLSPHFHLYFVCPRSKGSDAEAWLIYIGREK